VAWTWTEGSGGSGAGGGGSPPTATETVLFTARNASGGVIALVDETGTPAARFDYTPYGELARAEAWSSGGSGGGGGGGGVPGAAALALASRVGHQGLFFDNLETPWSNEQLALTPVTSGPSGPGLPTGFRAPAGLYHNRNRSYLPSLGRFAQRDPNASGQVVALADWWAGRDPRIWKQGLDILSQYSDGLGLHQYVQNDPINTRDAAGLFGIVDIGFGSSTIGELYQDHADRVTDIGSSAEASLTSMFEDYALDQLGDLLWAMDWDSPDFAYSASGIDPTAYGYGVIDDGSVGVVSDRFARAGIVKRIKHHIATNKNWVRGERWSVRFRALFDKAGLSLNDKANIMEIAAEHHQGPHPPGYHPKIFDRLSKAIEGLTGDAARQALINELNAIRAEIIENPDALKGIWK
jgi:RHS repeat-associated protein